jgi:hypothetical protein
MPDRAFTNSVQAARIVGSSERATQLDADLCNEFLWKHLSMTFAFSVKSFASNRRNKIPF